MSDKEEILNIVKEQPGLYTTQIAEIWGKDDEHQNRTYLILTKLEKEGTIRSEKRGNNRRWYWCGE